MIAAGSSLGRLQQILEQVGGYEDCITEYFLLCPVRGCKMRLRDQPGGHLPRCDGEHDWSEICGAVFDEMEVESEEINAKMEEVWGPIDEY